MSDFGHEVLSLLISAGILAAVLITLYILKVVSSRTGRTTLEWLKKRRYVRDARRHNKRARHIRLSRSTWAGLPLPQGREGSLRITKQMLLSDLKNLVQVGQYERALELRAEDLWVDLTRFEDIRTGDVVLKWTPRKRRRPREVY